MTATFGSSLRARSPLPDVFERGQVNVASCPLYEAATLIAPTSGSCVITGPTGQVATSGPVVVVSGVATYEWTVPTSTQLGEGWTVSWTLETEDHGVVRTRNEAMVARFRGVCPVSVHDLYTLAPALTPGTKAISAMDAEALDDKLTEAWTQVQSRLIAVGKRPYLVIGSYALREVTQLTALSIIFSGLQHRGNEALLATSQQYSLDLEKAWNRLKLTYDENDNGVPDPGKRAAKIGQLWIGRG